MSDTFVKWWMRGVGAWMVFYVSISAYAILIGVK